MRTDNEYTYYSKLSIIEQVLYKTKIFDFLRKLNKQYPHFDDWYERLFYYGGVSLNKDREIIFTEKVGRICGIIILKRQNTEKKICTLRVDSAFRNQGIATELIKCGLEWLGCDKPVITVSRRLKPQYKGLFDYFGFKVEDSKWAYYSLFTSEYAYNGLLDPKPIIINTVEISGIEGLLGVCIRNNIKPSDQKMREIQRTFDYIMYMTYEKIYNFTS